MNLVVFSDIFGMGKALKSTWITIWLSLNDAVYSVVEILYKVFMSVAEVNLFSKEMFQKITGRVYVVVGIAMLFIFAYNLILMIINPDDKKSTGQMTKVVKETIITLVLIVLLPTIFNYLSVFQKHVLSSNIIGQIIMGGVGGTSQQDCDKYTSYNVLTQNGISSTDLKSLSDECKTYNAQDAKYRGAASIPPTLFSAFLHPTYYGYYDCEQYVEKCASTSDNSCQMGLITTDNDKQMCSKYYFAIENSKFSGSLSPFYDDYFKDKLVDENDSSLQFNYLLSFVAGCFALYMFVCYTLAIGVRVAKLGFLQILSPIASMMRIIPKKKEAIFDKWLKNVIDTYLDVFIRLAIIYFALFAISLVPDVINVLLTSFENIYTVKLLSVVVVILGILKFAQEAPKLLKDFFGGGDAFALKSPIKQLGENKLAMAGLGAVRTGVGSAARNFFAAGREGRGMVKSALGGFIGGARRGATAGYKSDMKNLASNSDMAIEATTQKRKERQKYKALHPEGAIPGHIGDAVASHQRWIGIDGGADILDTINYEEELVKHYDDYKTMYESGGYNAMDARLKEMKAAKAAGQGYDGIAAGNDLNNAISELEKNMKDERIKAIKNNLQNAAYVAYEFSQSLNSDPNELAKIRDKLQLSDAQMDDLKSLSIVDNKVVDASGREVSEDLIVKLLEGDGSIDSNGKVRKGINGSSGDLKGKLNADKLSVAYKHQKRLEQERKEKEKK